MLEKLRDVDLSKVNKKQLILAIITSLLLFILGIILVFLNIRHSLNPTYYNPSKNSTSTSLNNSSNNIKNTPVESPNYNQSINSSYTVETKNISLESYDAEDIQKVLIGFFNSLNKKDYDNLVNYLYPTFVDEYAITPAKLEAYFSENFYDNNIFKIEYISEDKAKYSVGLLVSNANFGMASMRTEFELERISGELKIYITNMPK